MPDYPGFGRFAFVCYVDQYPQVVESVVKGEAHLRGIGRPYAADMLVKAYGQLRDDLVKLGAQQAIAGTATLRQIERQTRVRPDTAGQGGPRLGDSLVVRGATGTAAALIPGSIGVADLDLLDAKVPWWVTNEIGSSALIGHRLYGAFYGGGGASPPDPTEFRQHPLFEPGKGQGVYGLGIVQHPIPARRFIEKAVQAIDAAWRREFESARRRFEARLDTVAKTRR